MSDYMERDTMMSAEEISDDELLAEIKPRKKEKQNNDNYFQQGVRPYYDLIQRAYGPAFNKIVFSKAMQLFNKRPTMFRETIEWAVKNQLHPLAFAKTCNTILK